jgi:transcriptional regulator with XRE-family HTH domain
MTDELHDLDLKALLQRRAAGMRRIRLERGWSMYEAGKRLDHDVSAVSRWESGLRKPPSLRWIAFAYETTAAEIMRPCPRCRYQPPAGFQCLRCGTIGEEVTGDE